MNMELENGVDLADENLNVSLSDEEVQAIENTSLEDLFTSLEDIEESVQAIEDEEAPVDGLEPAMESLLGLVGEIRHSGGISRSDASTLMSMTSSMEGLHDTFKSLPLNSFTEVPSKVNYTASMENVVSGVIKKIIEAIRNAIKWIRDKLKKAWQWIRGSKVKTQQAEAAIAKVAKDTKANPIPSEAELKKTAEIAKGAVGNDKPATISSKEFEKMMADPQSKLVLGIVDTAKKNPQATADKVVELTLEQVADSMVGKIDVTMYNILYHDQANLTYKLTEENSRNILTFLNKQDFGGFLQNVASTYSKHLGRIGDVQSFKKDIQTPQDIREAGLQLSAMATAAFAKINDIGVKKEDVLGKIRTAGALKVMTDVAEHLTKDNTSRYREVSMLNEKTLSTLDHVVKKMESSVKEMERSGDVEKLTLAKAVFDFMHDRVAPMAIASHRRCGEMVFANARMAKVVYEWNDRRLASGQATLQGAFN